MVDIGTQPTWLDLPAEVAEEEPEQEVYWCCVGYILEVKPKRQSWWKRRQPPVVPPSLRWTTIYPTAEEAETNAAQQNECWEWSGDPARKITLSDAMRSARKRGRAGVQLQSYRNGKWKTLRKWPVGVPLNSRGEETG